MENFNVIITGVGGQGVITLVSLLDEACFVEGRDVRSSELHGLSQRGGSVVAHVKFGKKVYSPLVSEGSADLIIGLEITEALRDVNFSNKETKFLINDNFVGFDGSIIKDEAVAQLSKIAGNNFIFVPASKNCLEQLGKEVVSTIYLLGCAISKNILPLKKESVLQAIKNNIPEKFLDLNIKAFELGYSYAN